VSESSSSHGLHSLVLVPEPEPEPGADADPVQGSVSRKVIGGIQEKMDSARERARPRSFHSLVMSADSGIRSISSPVE
jgi:hypothetical protein